MTPAHERLLRWDGCLNVRDLGGHPTEDGGETRYGRVVRGDNVRQLTPAGWSAAVRHGVRTVLDLRYPEERQEDPPGDVPVEVVHLSLLGDLDMAWWDAIEVEARQAASLADATALVYAALVERHAERIAEAVRTVADASPGAVLVHCMGGKDRTGLVAAMLLRLAGVPVDDIAEDYALSGDMLRPRLERELAEAEDEAQRARIRRIGATPADAMRRVLLALEERHGSIGGYLRDAGADEAVLARARARLRD